VGINVLMSWSFCTVEDDEVLKMGDKLYDPRAILLHREVGCISSLDCSPYHRNIFLTTTLDGHICINNLSEVTKRTTILTTNWEWDRM